MVQAEIKGHYLILMWAEYANLKSPSGTAQRQALEQRKAQGMGAREQAEDDPAFC